MSTRSLTKFIDDEDGSVFCVMYRHWDGSPEAHGAQLVNFLSGKRIKNGISGADDKTKTFNGVHCLAASVIAHFKTEPGNIYLHHPKVKDVWEDYIYEISNNNGMPEVKCFVARDGKKGKEVKIPIT